MLWTILLILLILWMLGFVSGYMMDSVIHIPLFFAIVAMLIKIEDDYSNYGSCLTQKRYLKWHSISRSGKILPRRAILSAEREVTIHESADIGSGMAAASDSHRGLFRPSSQEQCAESRIQAAIYHPAAGDAVRTSSERNPGAGWQ
jgi:hypothetical protein